MDPADQATTTWESTSWERVTVNSALPPSATRPVGPLMPRVAVSSSVMVMVAGVTSSPAEAPCNWMASSPSTTWSPTGVTVKLVVPLVSPAVMVMLPTAVAV